MLSHTHMKIIMQSKTGFLISTITVLLFASLFIFSTAFTKEVSEKKIDNKRIQYYYLELKGTVRESIPSEVEEIKPIDSALISISGYLNQKAYSNKKGKCLIKLPLDKTYKIEVSKKGFVTKFIEVNTKIPFGTNTDFGFSFDIDLLENINRLDVSVLKKPIAKVLYDNLKGQFEYDVSYTNRINSELKKMYKEYYLLQKIQAFKNNENPKQDPKVDSAKKNIDSTIKNTLPERFRKFDLDNNSKISHAEAVRVIDSFFAGNLSIKVEDIIELIDFYFDQ